MQKGIIFVYVGTYLFRGFQDDFDHSFHWLKHTVLNYNIFAFIMTSLGTENNIFIKKKMLVCNWKM